MWSLSIPDVLNGDWPLMLVALDSAILVFLALWALLVVCVGTSTNKKEAIEKAVDRAPAARDLHPFAPTRVEGRLG